MSELGDNYLAVFCTPSGERVLKHLEAMFGVKDTLEPEEAMNKAFDALGEKQRMPIDVIGMAKRQGLRAAYWKIHAMIESAKERKTSES